jgi:intraflagellar transport protein 172
MHGIMPLQVPWRGSGNERFLVDNPSVCMVHNAGELSLVEYGCNEVLGTCRTEHLSPFLISVRLNNCPFQTPDPNSSMEENKKIAYLIDLQTIRILDLVRHASKSLLFPSHEPTKSYTSMTFHQSRPVNSASLSS